MVNKPRAKGTAWETAVNNYFQENGFPYATRNPLGSPEGDHANLPAVIEDKAVEKLSLGTWATQAEKASLRTGKPWVIVHKRRGKNVSKGWATTTLDFMTKLLKAWEEKNEK